jgi:VIT1/CCC1 family predicted Fe2+/Mn2+ transporter
MEGKRLWVRKGRSCSSPILVQAAAEQVSSMHHASMHHAPLILTDDGRPGWSVRWLKPERPVGTMAVVVLDIDPQNLLQVRSPNDQQPVHARSTHRADPRFGVRVRPGRLHGREQHLDSLGAEDVVEGAGDLRVPYVSVRSQRERLDATAGELDPATLAALREHEAGELALVFRARGLSPDQAEQRAAALLGDQEDQPAAPEGAAGEDVVGSAGAAAGSSFVAFASGAVIPLLPFFVSSGGTAIVTSALLVGVALFATGATVGVLTGGPLVGRGLRQLAIGAAAAVVTYALGRVFGACGVRKLVHSR